MSRDVVERPDLLASLVLLAVTVLWATRWESFPIFLDPYYHGVIAKQMVDAGGIITYEWWQDAPVGRVHLYPPALHLVLAGLLKAGCSQIFALRLLTLIVVPVLFLSLYLCVRQLAGRSTALATVCMGLIPFSWLVRISGMLASGLALIELLWLLVAAVQRRTVAMGGLLGLLFYTHLGLPWVAVAILLVGMPLQAWPAPRNVLKGLGLGLVIGAPWVIHVATHLIHLHITRRTENQFLPFVPVLYLFAGIGLWAAWRRASHRRVAVAALLGFLVMVYPFTFRWLSGEGLLPLILLAGIGFSALTRSFVGTKEPDRPNQPLFISSGLLILTMLLPTVSFSQSEGLDIQWWNTGPFHLLNLSPASQRGMDLHLYGPPVERLAQRLAALSSPDDILWGNSPHGTGLVAMLAHRPTSSAMFFEIPPSESFDPIGSARWILWFKVGQLPEVAPLGQLRQQYPLEPVLDTDLATVFRNRRTQGRPAHKPEATVSFGVAFMLLCGLLTVVIWDFRWAPHL